MWLYGRKLPIVCKHPASSGGCLTYGLKLHIVSQHLAKFSDHRLCGRSDTAAEILA